MTDLEMTRACAEAMGWKHLGAVGVEPPKRGEPDPKGLWCLSGGNDWWVNPQGYNVCAPCSGIPDPLHDDAQAMALEDWLIERGVLQFSKHWLTFSLGGDHYHEFQFPLDGSKERRRRAICECVAKMQKEKITT